MTRLGQIAIFTGLAIVASGQSILAQGQLPFNKSYAIVVGIDHYQVSRNWQSLQYARRDAEAITGLLKEQGFDEVIPLYNEKATKSAILSTMQDNLARRLTKDDRVVFFFAGHGYTDVVGGEDRGYLVPYDAKDSSQSLISIDELRFQASYMNNARHLLFVIDACYGGLMTVRASMVVDSKLPDYLRQITTRYAKQVLSAGGKGQQVVDNGPNGHSIFVASILEGIQQGLADYNGDGYVSFAELVNYVEPRATNAFQTPSSGTLPGHQGGEFIFRIRTPNPVLAPLSQGPMKAPTLRSNNPGLENRENIPQSSVAVPESNEVTKQPDLLRTVSAEKPKTLEDIMTQLGAKTVRNTSFGSASISGQITDESGAVIPGAKIGLVDIDGKSGALGGSTNEVGLFRVNCSPGRAYYVLIAAPGFHTVKVPMTIDSSSGRRLNVTMQVGDSSEILTARVK